MVSLPAGVFAAAGAFTRRVGAQLAAAGAPPVGAPVMSWRTVKMPSLVQQALPLPIDKVVSDTTNLMDQAAAALENVLLLSEARARLSERQPRRERDAPLTPALSPAGAGERGAGVSSGGGWGRE